MTRMYDRPTLGPDGWVVDETPTPAPLIWSLDASGNPVGLVGPGGVVLSANGSIDVRGYGAKSDGVAIYDATTTASSTCTVSSSSLSLTSADVGKPCVVGPRSSSGNYQRYGTITSIFSPTSCICAISGNPGANSANGFFAYGTDDTNAINAALVAAKAQRSSVFVPNGLTICTGSVTVPIGVEMFGVGNVATVDYAYNVEHCGSTMLLANYIASGGFVKLGDGSGATARGAILQGVNIDACNLAPAAVSQLGSGRASHVRHCTVMRGTGQALLGGASGVFTENILLQQQQGIPLVMGGDSRASNNYIYGKGTGQPLVKIGSSDNAFINNHLWADGNTNLVGSGVLLDFGYGGASPAYGSILIANNQFDTTVGPIVDIYVYNSSTLKAINICGNVGFANDGVADDTYSFIKLRVGSGSTLRGLAINDNTGQGSWNDPTQGEWTYFIDGSASAGTIQGSTVGGNVICDCNTGMYTGFTPDHDGGNITITSAGFMTKSTTT